MLPLQLVTSLRPNRKITFLQTEFCDHIAKLPPFGDQPLTVVSEYARKLGNPCRKAVISVIPDMRQLIRWGSETSWKCVRIRSASRREQPQNHMNLTDRRLTKVDKNLEPIG